MMSRTHRADGLGLFFVLSSIAFASPCIAQTAAPSPSGAGSASVSATAGEIRSLLASRSDADIRTDLESAAALQASAESELEKARAQSIALESRIEIKKKEIELIRSRVEAADKAKQETEKLAQETQKKSEEKQLQILERLHDVSSALEKKAEATIEAAKSAKDLCKREQELAQNRAQWEAFHAAPPAGEDIAKRSGELQRAVREAENHVLEAMKERAGKRADAAKADAEIADKVAEVYKAWNEAAAS